MPILSPHRRVFTTAKVFRPLVYPVSDTPGAGSSLAVLSVNWTLATRAYAVEHIFGFYGYPQGVPTEIAHTLLGYTTRASIPAGGYKSNCLTCTLSGHEALKPVDIDHHSRVPNVLAHKAIQVELSHLL